MARSGSRAFFTCLLLLQVAWVQRASSQMVVDFTPPPTGACPGPEICDTPANNVPSEFFVFRDVPKAEPQWAGPGGELTAIIVSRFPALEGLRTAYALLEIKPCGLVPPHLHPRGVEHDYVINGTMLLGFIDSQMKLRLMVLKQGDIAVVPQGNIHFAMSIDKYGFTSVAAFNNENSGIIFTHSGLLQLPDGVIRATTGLQDNDISKLRSLQEFANDFPSVDPVCLKAIKEGKEFDFMKGANNLAGRHPNERAQWRG